MTSGRRATLPCALCVAGWLLSGCHTAGNRHPASVARDSAGIAIVESFSPAWRAGAGWRLSDAPTLRIGEVEGEPPYLLLEVRSALRMTDGTIVVSNAGTEEIRFYDSAGRYLRTAGGRGGGPGEFMNLIWIYPLGEDSLLAWDDNPPRIAIFDQRGVFGRSLLATSVGGVLRGAFGDGSLLMAEHAVRSDAPHEGRIRPPARAYRLDPHGAVADTLPLFPGVEFHLAVMPPRGGRRGGVSLGPPPFGRRTVFATAGHGFYAGSQDDFAVGCYDEHGTLTALVRWSGGDRSVTPERMAQYERHELAGVTSETGRRRVAQYLDEQTYPDLLPAFGDILVDPRGDLWVEDYYLAGAATHRWRVFDPAHRMLGTVDVPVDFTMLQAGDDFVLGRVLDRMNVESVVAHRLIKPR